MSKVVQKKTISPLAQIKELDSDPKLVKLVAENLPPNYDFEIGKTVWRIRKTANCTKVALQMPEGLLIFATRLSKVLKELTGVDSILLGDVTYGACCIDDFTASMLGAQLLVHYGHSCLVPTLVANKIETIYIFVTIQISVPDAINSLTTLLKSKGYEKKKSVKGKIEMEEDEDKQKISVSLVSTIQFANSLPEIKKGLESIEDYKVVATIPRSKPLSSGEILGCTAPKVKDDLIVYVGDGRFHLEAMMMANKDIPAYRYDPYSKALTFEEFDHVGLDRSRQKSVNSLVEAKFNSTRLQIGIILGTLGRQGNPIPVDFVYQKLKESHNCFIVLMAEVLPEKLALFKDVDVWVQFACPRLSIDWGEAFPVPILTPFEAMWSLEGKNRNYNGHPMDYYAYESLGKHTPNFTPPKPPKECKKKECAC